VNNYCFVTSTYTLQADSEGMNWDKYGEPTFAINYYQVFLFIFCSSFNVFVSVYPLRSLFASCDVLCSALFLAVVSANTDRFAFISFAVVYFTDFVFSDINFGPIVTKCVVGRDMTVSEREEVIQDVVDDLSKVGLHFNFLLIIFV